MDIAYLFLQILAFVQLQGTSRSVITGVESSSPNLLRWDQQVPCHRRPSGRDNISVNLITMAIISLFGITGQLH